MKHFLLACIVALLALAVIPGDTPRPANGQAPTVNQCQPGEPGCIKVEDTQTVRITCREINGVLTDCREEPAYPAPGE